jgi:hypothetical protein
MNRYQKVLRYFLHLIGTSLTIHFQDLGNELEQQAIL